VKAFRSFAKTVWTRRKGKYDESVAWRANHGSGIVKKNVYPVWSSLPEILPSWRSAIILAMTHAELNRPAATAERSRSTAILSR